MDGDQVTVEIPSPEKKSNSNGEIEVEAIQNQKSESNYSFKKNRQVDPPSPPATDIQLNQDPGLRSRKKVSSFKASSSTMAIPKINDDDEKAETPKVTVSPRKEDDDDDDEDIYSAVYRIQTLKQRKNMLLHFIEFGIFVSIILVLILSKTMNKLKKSEIWSLELWKWCVLVLAIFCGRRVSEWLAKAIVLFIEKQFLLKNKVLYLIYGLKKSVQNFIWLGLFLLTWVLLIDRGVHRSRHTAKVVNYITRGIASTLVVAGVWIFRNLFVKMLHSSIHTNRFFDRILKSISEQCVVEILSGPPLMEILESNNSSSLPSKQLSFKSTTTKDGKVQKEENISIDLQKLQMMNGGTISDSIMKRFIKVVRTLGFSEPCNELDKLDEQKHMTFTNEWEAKAAGSSIYKNVAKLRHKYIEVDDLLRFMSRDEVKEVLALIGGEAETGKIKKKSFINWVVNACKKRKYLAASLKGTKKALMQLNKFITGFTVVVLLILWLILMGITTTEVLLFISSQFLLAVFSFGASFKSALESVMFVFVKHPFDVGDRCVLDGVQVVVEEVSILTTVFLRYDNEKIYYPNSLLATKAISNFNRSPEMSDSVDFELDVSTSVETIAALKAKIKAYIYGNPELWRPKQSVRVGEIEGANKLMKLTLYVTHTINFQDYELKSERRSNLVLELKKIFEQLEINYHILPPTSSN